MHTNSSWFSQRSVEGWKMAWHRDSVAISHIGNTHTHTSIEREGKIERGKEGEAGCVLAVGCSFFSKAVTYTRALYLLAQGFYVGFFLVPSAACRVSSNFVDLSNYRETTKGPDRIKMDADITSNHIRKIDKAKAERWVKQNWRSGVQV